MAEEKKTLYTEEGFKVLSDELDYLKNTKIQEVKEALKEARAFGDLSENSEYDEAKNEQAKVVSRIAELEELISNAQIISETEIQEDVINLGSVVQVHDFAFDEDIEYYIVGSNEANPLLGRISDLSPIGSAMLGHRAGDEVIFEAPNGEAKIKILSVHRKNKV